MSGNIEIALGSANRPGFVQTARCREFCVYFFASSAGLMVDGASLLLLIQRFGLAPIAAAPLAFIAGALVVYLLSVTFAFKTRRLSRVWAEFLVFFTIGIGGLGITMLVMWIGANVLAIDYRFVKLVAAGASFLANFGIRKLILFSKHEQFN